MMKRSVVLAILLSLNGCFLHSLSVMTAGDSEKFRLLQESAERFNRLVYWNESSKIVTMISPDAPVDVLSKVLIDGGAKSYRVEKVAPLNEGSAHVDVIFAVINSDTQRVEAMRKRELWEFRRVGGGWFLKDVLSSEVDEKTHPLKLGGSQL